MQKEGLDGEIGKQDCPCLLYASTHLPQEAISVYAAAPSRGYCRGYVCVVHLQLAECAKRPGVFLQKYIFTLAFVWWWFLEAGGRCGAQWMPLGCWVVIHLCGCGCRAQESAENCEEEKLARVI